MCIKQSINLINCELNICATFNSPWELLCISLFNYIASLLPVMNNLPVVNVCAGNRNPKLDRMKVQCISRASGFVRIQMHYHNISKWYNKENWRMDGESKWKKMRVGKVAEHWKGEESEQGRGKKLGVGGATVTAVQPLRSLMLPHQDLHVKVCVCMCLCMYELTLFSVSPVLAGRSCLCVALSHHLFLARLLISVLIISCSPLSVEVWRTCLISVLFPILIFHFFSSIHPSIHP